MSEFSAKTIRAARKAKASRLGNADPHSKVDSSDWTPAEPLNADVKTGARPVSRRAFKSGGKVCGEKAKANMGRSPRKAGGASPKDYANAKINRNVKDANEEREGIKHVGGFKKGGRAKKLSGGALDALSFLSPAAMVYNLAKGGDKDKDEKARGGRAKREYGGRGVGERTQTEVARRNAVQAATDYGDDPRMTEGKLREATRAYEDKKTQTAYKKGGRTKKMDGGGMMPGMVPMVGADPRMNIVQPNRMKFSGAQGSPYKKGGKVHSDEAEDKKLIKKMVKPSARTGKADGGEMKYLGAGRPGSKGKQDAEKEYGPSESALDRGMNKIAAEFSPWKMREMRKGVADARAKNKDMQAFIDRKKKRDESESMEKAGYKAGGRKAHADGGDIGAGPGKRTDRPASSYEPTYNEESVDKAIRSSRQKIGGKEAAMIKQVLKGRTGRATGGRAKGKGKTNINIIISAGKGQPQDGGPGMPPGMPPGGPMSLQRPMGPPPGMPPMPPGMPAGGPPGMGQPPMPPMARKSGGRITKVARSYKDMEAGAASGEGRLQKTDIAKRIPKKREDGVIETDKRGYPNKVIGANGGRTAHKAGGKVYRSYKDMDAGAGSGMGRLEKEEIQKRKH